tara:strand:- start:75 stop:1733 length:1659 start_codon:yes stop_codon:yes gene_type:complete
MKHLYFLLLTFSSINIYSQCPDPDIFWFQTGEDFVFLNGNNNNQIDYYEVEYKAYETFTPGDGTAETYTFSGFPHTIPGLMPGTPYYFTNRSICNDGSTSEWNDNGNNGPDLWSTNMEPGEFSAENVLSHNSSQEITHEPSQICESEEVEYDFIFEGANADPGVSCPETTFTALMDGPYIITITDSYGDGWAGNIVGNETVLDVLVNGSVVLDDITLASGFSTEFTFNANTGDEISTQWVNQGTWFYEVGYSIISQNSDSEVVTSVGAQVYTRSYIPADFGYEGNVTIGAVELGIWYSDAEGNYNPDLPVTDTGGTPYQNIFLYRQTNGGVGTSNIGQQQPYWEQIAFKLNFEITPEDHQTVITVPLDFLPGFGNLNGNGVEVSANDDIIVQVWMGPGSEELTGFPGGVRKFIGGNLSDFTVLPEDATNYPYPAVQTGPWIDSTCEYYNYVTDNTSLMNLVIGSNNELSNDHFEINSIKLFPNPLDKNDKFLNISFGSNNLKLINIFDLMGRKVYHSETVDNRIELTSLNAGTYIVEIKINDQLQRSKLIIK